MARVSARDRTMVSRYLEGETMVTQARDCGISPQRVSAILADLVTDDERAARALRIKDAWKAGRVLRFPRIKYHATRTCAVCGSRVPIKRRATCSVACATT